MEPVSYTITHDPYRIIRLTRLKDRRPVWILGTAIVCVEPARNASEGTFVVIEGRSEPFECAEEPEEVLKLMGFDIQALPIEKRA